MARRIASTDHILSLRALGQSWTEIAAATGVSKHAAWQRHKLATVPGYREKRNAKVQAKRDAIRALAEAKRLDAEFLLTPAPSPTREDA